MKLTARVSAYMKTGRRGDGESGSVMLLSMMCLQMLYKVAGVQIGRTAADSPNYSLAS